MSSQEHTDESIRSGTGSVSKASITINASVKDWMVGLVLALSIGTNLLCWWTIDAAKAEVRLKEYDLDKFRSGEFSDLKATVNVLASKR